MMILAWFRLLAQVGGNANAVCVILVSGFSLIKLWV